jgi:succinate dehydrogenase/fumarate reductase flavoprotein subunit
MLDNAEMAAKCALMRTESRELHERADYPEARTEWLKHIIVCKSGDKMQLTTEPVIFSHVKPPESGSNML